MMSRSPGSNRRRRSVAGRRAAARDRGDADAAAAPAGPGPLSSSALGRRPGTQRGKDEHGTADGPAGAGHRRGVRPGRRDRRGVRGRGRGGGGAGHGGARRPRGCPPGPATCGPTSPTTPPCGPRCSAAAERLGGLDLLVNNAGIGAQGSVERQHRRRVAAGAGRERDRTARVSRAAWPYLRESGHGRGGQHGLDRGHRRAAGPGRVLGQQGRGGRADPGHGRRRDARRHPGQRGEPGTADTPWVARLVDVAPDPAADGPRWRRRAHGRLVSAGGRRGPPRSPSPRPAAGSTTGAELTVDSGIAASPRPRA